MKALRSLPTAHLPEMLPRLRSITEQGLQSEFQLYDKPDGRKSESMEEEPAISDNPAGSSHIPTSRTVKNLICKANCFVFFGERIGT